MDQLVEKLSERLQTPISTAELERRWAAVRAAMERDKIDVLLMQNNNDHMGGYVKYFTDLPATNGYPLTVVFPRDDLMTLVSQGPFGGRNNPTTHGDGTARGVKQWLTTPSFASCYYTADYDPELAAKALAPYAGGTIGFLGTYQMSFALVDHLQKGRFSNSRFVDASDLVDRIKVIKSAEERELIRRTAAMQDGAMHAAFAAVEPGMRDRDIAAIAQCHSQRNGSENGIYLCASMPPDQPAQFSQRHYQNRNIQKGDTVALLVEDSGPGGMYAELGRTCVVGKASAELKEEFAFALEARKFNLGLLKPGAPCKDVFAAYNDFMRKNGRPEEKRLHCHGQGYDLVERPLIRHDEPMSIAKDMNIVVHPTYIRGHVLSWVCDNYLIEANGPGERLHRFPEIITELG
ncbi:MAG: M24 family metallopeptidase [Xanthobacteraceae bacterium]|nr:M24 family metallopeptidase [Xanthobacteraceae bacterium]